MSWLLDIFKIISAVLFSIFGAGSIILVLSSWLGKVWANRILEQDKAKYNREIEELKTKFDKELEYYKSQLELSKITLSRYSEHQFGLYNKLWSSLAELKISGDNLWYKVDEDSVLDFGIKVKRAQEDLLKNILLIEEQHEKELTEILDKFANFSFGKFRLIQLDKQSKKDPNFLVTLGDALTRHSVTENNKVLKDAYDRLLILIKDSFRRQLRGR